MHALRYRFWFCRYAGLTANLRSLRSRIEMTQRPLLLVEDDPALIPALVRTFKPYRACVTATTALDACAAIDQQLFCGLVVDVGLETPLAGLDVLRRFRERHPREPAMVFTGQMEREIIDAADDLRARLVMKSGATERLRAFGLECASSDVHDIDAVNDALRDLTRRARLSQVEVAPLVAALRGLRGEQCRQEQSIPLSTHKWRVGSLLKKTGHDSLECLTNAVLLDALKRASAPVPL